MAVRRLKLVSKSRFLCILDIEVDDNQGDDSDIKGDDDGNKDAESDVDHDDDDSNDGGVVDDDDMEGEDITKDKGLRHRHECQELPVQTQEDSNKENTDQGNKRK